MAITGQISLARTGQTVQVFQEERDINAIFDANQAPSLQDFDHVTLYPGDFTDIDPITVPENVFLTILPGASVNYKFSLDEIDRASRLAERYEDIGGNVENVADLNIAHLYETSIEKQFSRVRIYGGENNPSPNPFVEYNNLEEAAENAREGDSVVVFPGNYDPEKNLLVDNTTWKFLPGAVVRFDPNYQIDIDRDGSTENVRPFALFDDSRTFNGGRDDTPKNFDVFGDATFIVGADTEKTLVSRSTPGSVYEPITISSQTTWFGWHKYSILSVANPSSEIRFNAEKIRMENVIDGAVKYSCSRSLKVNVNEVEIAESNEPGSNVESIGSSDVFDSPEEPKVPAFLLINGHNVSKASAENIEVNISEFNVERDTTEPLYVVSAFNHSPEDVYNSFRDPFSGNVSVSVEKSDEQVEEAVVFSDRTSPGAVVVKDSELYAPFLFAGNDDPASSKLILKETSIKVGEGDYPVLLSGNGEGFSLSISGTWLINESGTTNDQYSIKDDTEDSLATGSTTNVQIKAYKNCFANKPIEKYKISLHDDLNNVIWTEDVELLSI